MTVNAYGTTSPDIDAQRETWNVNNLIELDRTDLVADLLEAQPASPVVTGSTGTGSTDIAATDTAAISTDRAATPAAVRRGTRVALRAQRRYQR